MNVSNPLDSGLGLAQHVTGDMINYLKEELLQTWDGFLIPDYHRAVFLDCIYGLQPP
jgi:hypothetical protein